MEREKKVCCICGCEMKGWGNDPWGAVWKNEDGDLESKDFGPEDECCDECNSKYVIPGRLYRAKRALQRELKDGE